MSEDRQLRAVHLILGFKPLSNLFQDLGQAIRVSDPKLARIDISVPSFLARKDLPLVELPFHCSPQEVAALREEITSSRLSLETEIDQFRLEEEGEMQERPVELSNSKGEFDRSSMAHSPRLIIARVDNNSEEEEDMALNPRKGLKDILAGRNKGSSSKETPKTQLPPNLPPPHLPSPLGILSNPNLQKKKRKEKDIEEGKMLPKDPKQHKITKDRLRESLVKSRGPSTRPMYVFQLGTPSWNWMAGRYPKTFLSRIPKRSCPSCGRDFRAPSLASQGHRCLEESKAARAFPVTEEGSSPSKPLGTIYSFPFLLFCFVSNILLYFLYAGYPGSFRGQGMGQ